MWIKNRKNSGFKPKFLVYVCCIEQPLHIETNLHQIASLSHINDADNHRFISFLKLQNTTLVDEKVQELNEVITPQIDCKDCGNCCKSLMINVTDAEANAVAAHLQLQRNDFDMQFIEKGSAGTLLINSIPCPFLNNTQCSIYEQRFQGCSEFPGLHVPGFSKRTFTTFMHYNRCPIIFNVVEHLKLALNFV